LENTAVKSFITLWPAPAVDIPKITLKEANPYDIEGEQIDKGGEVSKGNFCSNFSKIFNFKQSLFDQDKIIRFPVQL